MANNETNKVSKMGERTHSELMTEICEIITPHDDKPLYELGLQYLEEAERIHKHIDDLRQKAKGLRGREHALVERRIAMYYRMAEECYRTGTYLKFYYSEGYISVAKDFRI